MNIEEELTAVIESLMDEQKLDLHTRLRIVANLLIREGLAHIPQEELPDEVNPENIMDVVLSLREKYGETLPMAVVHQGLVMLMWLENTD